MVPRRQIGIVFLAEVVFVTFTRLKQFEQHSISRKWCVAEEYTLGTPEIVRTFLSQILVDISGTLRTTIEGRNPLRRLRAKGIREMSDLILRLPQVRVRVGLSRSSIYAAVAEGRFPKPIRLGARAAGWLESEVTAWVQGRVELT